MTLLAKASVIRALQVRHLLMSASIGNTCLPPIRATTHVLLLVIFAMTLVRPDSVLWGIVCVII